MIYSKPGEKICVAVPQSQVSYDTKTSENLCETVRVYETGDIAPCIPIKVKRANIRRTARSIKRQKSHLSLGMAIFSCVFCLCVSSLILYLCKEGVYAPKQVCTFFAHTLEKIYADKTQVAKTFDSKDNAKQFFRESGGQTNYTSATLGEGIEEIIEAKEYDRAQTQNVSTDIPIKTGTDGKILYARTQNNLSADDFFKITNETSYKVDTVSVFNNTPKSLENVTIDQNPLVLIVHTHGTECYSNTDGNMYEKDMPTRSTDINENVVSVGKEIKEVLESFGIGTIHSTVMCDKDSFITAYTTSKKLVQNYLKEYPSIKFVIDVHRDSITKSDGEKIAPTLSASGNEYAQLMFVVGTDESGTKHKNWENNLSLALNLQNALEEDYPGICRPINLRSASFNQQLCDGHLILEVGSCASTLSQAKNSARAFAGVLAKNIIAQSKINN